MDAAQLHSHICICDLSTRLPVAARVDTRAGGPGGRRHRHLDGMGLLGSTSTGGGTADSTSLNAAASAKLVMQLHPTPGTNTMVPSTRLRASSLVHLLGSVAPISGHPPQRSAT